MHYLYELDFFSVHQSFLWEFFYCLMVSKLFRFFLVLFIDNLVATYDENIDIKTCFFKVEICFIVFIGIENCSKASKITVLSCMVQVLLQYKVGATPKLRPPS